MSMESWKAEARLFWPDGGGFHVVKHWIFRVDHPEIPPTAPTQAREVATLDLVCLATDRYATPPQAISARLLEAGLEPAPAWAKWHAALGFVYGGGTRRVSPPRPGATMRELVERDVEQSDA
jgi:hypothetical protein